MSVVEVLGSLDGYPVLLTIDEAADVMRIGRSLAYGMAHQYESSHGTAGLPVCGSGHAFGCPAGRSSSCSPPAESSAWPMDRRPDADLAGTLTSASAVLTIGAAAENRRRALGPVAWAALEVLATSPSEGEGEGWVVRASVRTIAGRLGVAVNTAQRALRVLRDAKLIEHAQARAGTGRFDAACYRLEIPADVLIVGTAPNDRLPTRSLSSSHHAKPSPIAEQLLLLPT